MGPGESIWCIDSPGPGASTGVSARQNKEPFYSENFLNKDELVMLGHGSPGSFRRVVQPQYSHSMEQRSSGSTPWWGRDQENPTPDEHWMLRRVEDRFAIEAAGLSEWADPHADPSNPGHRLEPKEEEYSRCLEPEKYTIVQARAAAWTAVLTELGWAAARTTSEEFDAPDHQIEWALPPWTSHAQGHMTVLRPEAEGAVPLTFWTVDAAEDTGASVAIAAGDPAVFLELTPDCGCDACDSGSEDLLECMDESVLAVVSGSLKRELRVGIIAFRRRENTANRIWA